MHLVINFSADVDTKSFLGLDEDYIEGLLNSVIDYIFVDDNVALLTSYKDIFERDYESIEIDFSFVDDISIRDMNKQYRGVDSATDVLSFALLEGAGSEVFNFPVLSLGSVVVSVETLIEQAKQNNVSNVAELVYLFSHGVLHLLGLHHDTDDAYENIISIQKRVVKNVLNK